MREHGMTTDETVQEADGPAYSLSLTGEGITVEREVSADVAREIISVVMGGTVGPRGARPAKPGARTPSGLSLREFIDAAGAKKNPQIVAAIGLYMSDHEGQARFTRGEVK